MRLNQSSAGLYHPFSEGRLLVGYRWRLQGKRPFFPRLTYSINSVDSAVAIRPGK
ncbi:MAG: hypothetical protein M5U34_46485 [Chloroflexi bacterium]|nr:hypothetical protein [Chloroflexota bacterium]